MIVNMYAFFDKKATVYSVPFFFNHDVYAFRAASEIAKDPGTPMGRHPSDFDLVRLGVFNDSNGMFELHPPHTLGVLAALLEPVQPPLGGIG